MHLLLVTDAWRPQINGVVRTLEAMMRELEGMGVTADIVSPADFRSMPMPGYPEIQLALAGPRALARRIRQLRPDAIHIATEGPLGLAARSACRKLGLSFTSSYHTRFPEYLRARLPVPVSVSFAVMRWFHAASSGVMVSTKTLHDELAANGFRHLLRWSRGVDTALFRPDAAHALDLPRPLFLSVGRVAVEKNLEAFLSLDLPGTKIVVGDGPARAELQQKYPQAHFVGAKTGIDLAGYYAAADVFVFPSLTDTFGLVLLEALAAGTPVAAFPVPGPLDVVGGTDVAVLDTDLRRAALAALDIPRPHCRAFAERLSWQSSARQFLGNLVTVDGAATSPPDPAPDQAPFSGHMRLNTPSFSTIR